ncbi:MAG: Asp-tRNA(Asn)/Glu-tRNA(Gln) amidotransferase GatCAB subunit C [Rhodospirillaceae bacterium]|nr:Asp-tRNA(Asn)/Glu-tRNA(Gln) amidotransferase GatCAB subunit C [Rhodospirillaceae bacterium]
MPIDNAAVHKIAKLSRIKINDNQVAATAKELESILNWIETLQEVNTDNVLPMIGGSDIQSLGRDDVVNDGNYSDKILANAPEAREDFFGVPKVIE